MKRIHRSLLLAGVLLAFGGGSFLYAYVTEIKQRPKKKIEADEKRRLFQFGRDHVTKGTIHARGATIAFARDPDYGWRITSPADTPADATAIDAALDHMATIRGDLVESGEVTAQVLQRYELDHPRLWIEVETSKGPFTLLVGPKNPIDERYFVTDGERKKIVLADSAFHGSLDRSLDAFRDRRIFAVPASEVRRIRVTEKGRTRFELTRDASGLTVTEGRSAPIAADDGEANLLVISLTNRLRADRYLTDALASEDEGYLASLGFRQFDVAIEIEARTGKRMVGQLGFFRETSAERVATVIHIVGSKTVALVPDSVRQDIDKGLRELRDRTISKLDREQVKRIELVRGDGSSLLFERSDARPDAWTAGKDKKPALAWKVVPLLNATSHLKASRIVSDHAPASELSSLALDPPALRIRATDASQAVLADVDIGRDLGKDEVAIRKHGAPEIGALPKKLLEIIPESEDEVLDHGAR